MSIFYVKNEQINNGIAKITGEDVNHIKNVLRYNVGDSLNICDEQGIRYLTSISKFEKDSITLNIDEVSDYTTEPNINVTLIQGLPKGDKFELIIQKCTEIGVSKIIPAITDRVIVKLDDKNIDKKVERWNKIALEASKQSGRQKIPVVEKPINLKKLIENISKYDILLLPYECEKVITLKSILKNVSKDCKNIAIMIGPEGGFSDEEIESLNLENVKRVTLGPRILRTETAGLATLAIVLYELQEN